MTNKEILKKQIIYRSTHRGTKEMDILLGNFTKKYIDEFSEEELKDLEQIVSIDDDSLYQWYFDIKNFELISKNRVSRMLKNYKL